MGKSTFLQDFKAFAMKGNVVDMAVGVIIGGAFGKIVSSVVADIIMPPPGVTHWGSELYGLEMGNESCAVRSRWERNCGCCYLELW